jgi:small subunit ribosomal protein S4e
MRRNVKVDHKIRTDINYPAGFQDIVQIDASNENFRLLYDVKGRFTMHRVQPEEAQYKLVRVKSVAKSKKATSGRNPYQTGQRAAIPIATTHDGRTIRFADPDWKVNDTLKFNIATGKVEGHLKFEVGRLAMITGTHTHWHTVTHSV